MTSARSTCGLFFGLVGWASLVGGCAARSSSIEPASPTNAHGLPDKAPKTVQAETPRPRAEGSSGAAAQGRDEPAATGPTHLIYYHFSPDKPLYYVIENDFVDHGGVPGFLSYTTIVNDRRTIIQTVEPPINAKKPTARSDSVRLLWVCDRYEVTEKGMNDTVSFDSLRDLYPRATLRALGAVPGSKVFFDFDPHTGEAADLRIQPGKRHGPVTRKKLSSTAKRCEITQDNMVTLLDDLGSLFIPHSAKAVGETWTRRREERGRSYGGATRNYRFTLKDVREEAGRKIATIEVQGDVQLPTNQEPAATQAVTQSKPKTKTAQGAQRTPAKPRRQFKIDKALCTGSIEFDLTHRRLARLTLRRAVDLSAKMESKDNRQMSIETGSYHSLRVEVSEVPPPKPMIVGGPKPPPEEPEETPRQAARPPDRAGSSNAGARPRRRSGATSQRAENPARSGRRLPPAQAHRHPPAILSRERAPREQVLPPRPTSQPTSQPAETPP